MEMKGIEPELRDFWDERLEYNLLRTGPKERDADAHLSWMIEAGGDILREKCGKFGDVGYMCEKICRIKRHLKERDWHAPLSETGRKGLEDIKTKVAEMEPKTKEGKAIVDLIASMADRNVTKISYNLGVVEALITKDSSDLCSCEY